MNIIDLPGVVTTYHRTYWGNSGEHPGGYIQYYYGSGPESHDGNASTYYGISQLASGKDREFGACSATVTHTWPTPVAVGEVYSKMYGQSNAYTGNYANRGVNPQILHRMQLRISGVWTTVWQYTDPYYPGDAQANEVKTSTPTITGDWTNVTGFRVYSYAASYTYEGGRTSRTWAYIYDMSAVPTDLVVEVDTLDIRGTVWTVPDFDWTVEIPDPLALVAQHDGVVLPLTIDLADVQWVAIDVWSSQYMSISKKYPGYEPNVPLTPDGVLTFHFIPGDRDPWMIGEIRRLNQWVTLYWWVGSHGNYGAYESLYTQFTPATTDPLVLYIGSLRVVNVKAYSFEVIYPDRDLNTGYSYTNPYGEQQYLDLYGDLTLNAPTISISPFIVLDDILDGPLHMDGRLLDNTFNNARFIPPHPLHLGIYAIGPNDAHFIPDGESGDFHLSIIIGLDENTWTQLASMDLVSTLYDDVNIDITQIPDYAAFFAMTATVNDPYVFETRIVRPGTLGLNTRLVVDPHTGIGATIVRYIKDPITTGGCPQCGTFLYKEYGARELQTDDVFTGRNFSIRGEEKYFWCSRCNFPVKVKRHASMKKGSFAGWGMKYDEIRADASGDA